MVASTVTGRSPACAEETFSPRTVIRAPGAAARATRSAALTTLGSPRRCGASVEYTPISLHRGPQLGVAGIETNVVSGSLRGNPESFCHCAGNAQQACIGAREKHAGIGGDVNRPPWSETATPCTASSGRLVVTSSQFAPPFTVCSTCGDGNPGIAFSGRAPSTASAILESLGSTQNRSTVPPAGRCRES